MAVDYFLKIDGAPGESGDAKHKNEIHLQSWSFGAVNTPAPPTSKGRGAGKVQVQDFHFTVSINKSSGPLFLACCKGQHYKTAQVTARRQGKDQQEYLKIEMSDVLVSSWQVNGSEHGDIPMESVSLTFNKIKWTYAPQKEDGTLAASADSLYDLIAQTKEG